MKKEFEHEKMIRKNSELLVFYGFVENC